MEAYLTVFVYSVQNRIYNLFQAYYSVLRVVCPVPVVLGEKTGLGVLVFIRPTGLAGIARL